MERGVNQNSLRIKNAMSCGSGKERQKKVLMVADVIKGIATILISIIYVCILVLILNGFPNDNKWQLIIALCLLTLIYLGIFYAFWGDYAL
ncbi:MAG: hypothetical protein KAU16_08925 [Methanophagales archaeon]|nr:hypothetical protein [Methanophagales archaeon]